MTQVTSKWMDPSPYLYTKGQKVIGEEERVKKKVHHGKPSEKGVTDQRRSTRLSVQVSCNNSTRFIDKPMRRVWVRGAPRLKDSTRFLDCNECFPLNVRI